MNAIWLANSGFYNGCIFHRVIKGFMSQTGDPTGTGKGGSNIWGSSGCEDEFDGRLKHDKYSLSMANAGPGTAKSQFFITAKDCGHLDGKHTIWGRVVKGTEVADSINSVSTKKDRPIEAVKIIEFDIHVDKVTEALDAVYARAEERKLVERQKIERGKRLREEAQAEARAREGGHADEEVNEVGRYLKVGQAEFGGTRLELESGTAGGTADSSSGGGGDFFGSSVPPQARKKKKVGGGFGNFSSW